MSLSSIFFREVARVLLTLTLLLTACNPIAITVAPTPVPASPVPPTTQIPSPTSTRARFATATSFPSLTPVIAPTLTPAITDLAQENCCLPEQVTENQRLNEQQKKFVLALTQAHFTVDIAYSNAFSQLASSVKFYDGLASYPCPSDSSYPCYAYLTQAIVFGDLNLDGVEDAVAIISLDDNNVLYDELAIFLNRNGKPANIVTRYIEWNSLITELRIEKGIIVLEFLKHKRYDSKASPTQSETWHLKLVNDKLVHSP